MSDLCLQVQFWLSELSAEVAERLTKDLKQVIGVIFYILLVYLYMCSLTQQQ
jgi:hypothetical protein